MDAVTNRENYNVTGANDSTRSAVFEAFDHWEASKDIWLLSEFDRTLVLVWSLVGIIPGEGMGDFYETATAAYRDENVASLERIGAHEVAGVIRKANEVFARWETEHTNQVDQKWSRYEARGRFVSEEDDQHESDQDELQALESQFCALIKDVELLLNRYVEDHITQ